MFERIKINIVGIFFLSTIAVANLASCNDAVELDDGDWPSLEWQTDVQMKKDNTIIVPTEGGEFKFICSNNYSIWISSIKENDKENIPDNRYHINCKWIKVNIYNDKVLIVNISHNESGVLRTAKVRISGGDNFDSFTFLQGL